MPKSKQSGKNQRGFAATDIASSENTIAAR
jgi:hypothetical protein